MRIGVLGLGPVGGFIAAKLLSTKTDNSIHLLARERHILPITKHGLILESNGIKEVQVPQFISTPLHARTQLDVLFIATKSYDLESSIDSVRHLIARNTIIIPLLNGVDAKERIHKVLPEANVIEACVYIVSRLIEPGYIKVFSPFHAVVVDLNTINEIAQELLVAMKNAGINVEIPSNYQERAWEKFMFISPLASLSCYLNLPLGPIINDSEHKNLMIQLMNELLIVANAKGINLDNSAIDRNLELMHKLDPDTMASMHTDFINGKPTESKSLLYYIPEQAKKLGVETPCYLKLANQLSVHQNIKLDHVGLQ